MSTWVIISITLVCLIIITITTLILLKKTILVDGNPFPTSTIKITNTSTLTFDTITCYDTHGKMYTPIQGVSTPRLFTPQDSFIVNMKNQTSLLCIALKDMTQYITILGNDNSTVYFVYSNTDKNTFTFSNTTELPQNITILNNIYNGTIVIPTAIDDSKLLLDGDPIPPTSIILSNGLSDSILLSEFININNPGNLTIGSGLSTVPLPITLQSSCIIYGKIISNDLVPYVTGIALYNVNNTIKFIQLGISNLTVSRPLISISI
jgi:hypothetical protein